MSDENVYFTMYVTLSIHIFWLCQSLAIYLLSLKLGSWWLGWESDDALNWIYSHEEIFNFFPKFKTRAWEKKTIVVLIDNYILAIKIALSMTGDSEAKPKITC